MPGEPKEKAPGALPHTPSTVNSICTTNLVDEGSDVNDLDDSGIYFDKLQFPLVALSYGRSIQERISAIIGCGALSAGEFIEENYGINPESNQANETGARWAEGLESFQIDEWTTDSMKVTLQDGIRLREYCAGIERRFGSDALVRISTEFVEEVFCRECEGAGRGMDYDEFSILSAIQSSVGKGDRPAILTREIIRNRAAGYRNLRMANELGRCRADGESLLTDRRVRYILDKLADRHLIFRAALSKRQNCFSAHGAHKATFLAHVEELRRLMREEPRFR